VTTIAVVTLSGGMDSCVTAAIARESHRLALLHARYGQRTEMREEKAFRDIADHYGVGRKMRLVIPAPHFSFIKGSSLTDAGRMIPLSMPGKGEVPSTYVPFRNAFILSAAVSWAEALGARRVFTGITEADCSGYPDCRSAFVDAFNRLVAAGTRRGSRIRVKAPLLRLTKSEIVRKGIALGAPFHLTWSCYLSKGPEACGRCASCRLRLKGFHEAGLPDPIPYSITPQEVTRGI